MNTSSKKTQRSRARRAPKPQRGKRGRSSPATGASIDPTRPQADGQSPCPAAQEARRLEVRIAKLEAELHRTSALLGDAFHDAPELQQLRLFTDPIDGYGCDTYAAAALGSVWRQRLMDELLPVVREAQKTPKVECIPVDPAVAASWCIPHPVVPSVVAARVVMRLAAPDVALIGNGISGVVSMNAPAEVQIETLHDALLPLRERRRYDRPDAPDFLEKLLRQLCGATLRKVDLERLAGVLSRFSGNIAEFLATWCQFRLGTASPDALLGCYYMPDSVQKAVFGTQLAVDEFFLPTASHWTLEQVASYHFRQIFDAADIDKLATVDFRDQFFLRLASTQDTSYVNKEGMYHLTFMLRFTFLRERTTMKNFSMKNLFLDPQFVVDVCAQALRFVDDSDEMSTFVFKRVFEVMWQSAKTLDWPPSIAETARDTVFVPAVACADRLPNSCRRVQPLTGPLEEITRNPSCAALFCTADFRDDFFVGLAASRGPGGWFSTWSALSFARALANVAAAVPRVQRQALFATEQFRDEVMALLILSIERGVHDVSSCPELVPAVRAALLCIAEMDDGSLHEVFAGDTFRALLASHDDQCEQSPVS